jgi:hypothetical protein
MINKSRKKNLKYRRISRINKKSIGGTPFFCSHSNGWKVDCLIKRQEGWWVCVDCGHRKMMSLLDCNMYCNWNCSHTITGSTQILRNEL